jgi:3-hydroxyisobutyrate dehydrogenase
VIAPGATIGFIGLGNMGLPMARRLATAGFAVKAFDVSAAAGEDLARTSSAAIATTAAEAARDAAAVVLMLPSSTVVEHVLRADGVLDALGPGTLVVDMSSSQPLSTRALAAEAAGRGAELVDAPVSGGVSGAVEGTLTIMLGGSADAARACAPLLAELGGRVVPVGEVGAGHAVKALNNLLSATSLLATSEAVAIGRAFGIDPAVLIDAVNVSSGRSGSTEQKFPRFVLSESYNSGFSAALMVKDLRVAVGLAEELGVGSTLSAASARLWDRALTEMAPDADHTEIARWVDRAPEPPAR